MSVISERKQEHLALCAEREVEAERADATLKASRRQQRRVNRGALPRHLPREESVIEPDHQTCPCCGGALHRIGEDVEGVHQPPV